MDSRLHDEYTYQPVNAYTRQYTLCHSDARAHAVHARIDELMTHTIAVKYKVPSCECLLHVLV